MILATPGSRSAQFSTPVLLSIIAVFSALLFMMLGIMDGITGATHGQGFIGHMIDIMSPAWLVSVLIVIFVQLVRKFSGALSSKSWPWVIAIFVIGILIDLYVLQRTNAACGLVAAVTYIFLFTRWFTGKSALSGDK
jgi:hypothetical protein